MRFGIILASALLCITGLQGQTPPPASKTADKSKQKHPHLHHALWALHHAHHELKESKEEYAGHKAKALHDINGAIKHIDAILKHENDNVQGTPGKGQLAEIHKKYKHHPFLHHAIHEVKSAHHQLKETKDDFGGNRHKALVDMDHAVHQIALVLKHAKIEDTTKK